MKESISAWAGVAICSVALGLLFPSCSSSEPKDLTTAQSSSVEEVLDKLQALEMRAGKSTSLELQAEGLRLESNSNTKALKIKQEGQTLRLEGLRYGVSTLTFLDSKSGKSHKLNVWVSGERPRIALEYFAPYNVAKGGKTLAGNGAGAESGLFGFSEAQSLQVEHQGQLYRTPGQLELRALFPYQEQLTYNRARRINYMEELIEVAGEAKWYAESMYTPGRGVAYALRFAKPNRTGSRAGHPYATDNSMQTAYRYEYGPNPEEKGGYRVLIRARYLGETFTGGMPVVANEGFWQSYTREDVTLSLPTTGLQIRQDTGMAVGFASGAEYHSRDLSSEKFCSWAMNFHASGASLSIHSDTITLRPIRPILVNNK